ncbi:MAG TPA: DUF3810 family protein [Blastocatellia bacterium]|nr:DUF3810 family protein [Blastocatellia bacterium]
MDRFSSARINRPPWRTILVVSVIALAVILMVFPPPADFVERYYSRGLYPKIQAIFTPVTNHIPFAVVDGLLVALAVGLPAWWVMRIRSAGRGRRGRAALVMLFNMLALAAALSLSFQFLWGFNYFREPLVEKIEFDESRLNSESLKQVYRASVEGLNRESGEARAGGWLAENEWSEGLDESFNAVLMELGNRRAIPTGVPKSSLLNLYLGAAGVDGFTNPYGHEVILVSELLPFEKPFTLAHEWAHLAGFADESEASFVALLACLRSDLPAVRYSGWLALFMHTHWPAPPDQNNGQAAEPPPRLSPEVIADLKAIQERDLSQRIELVSEVQGQFYDGFLKANRVEAGIASYGLLVRLVMGARFERAWVPALRADSQ